MQNNFQACSQLKIEDEFSKTGKNNDSLGKLLSLQKSIQQDLYGHDFEKMRESIRTLKKFIDMNEEAIRDEDREFQEALTGIHSFPGRWKPWKKDHEEAMQRPFSALTEEEVLELQYEWIDKLHFMFNEALAIGLDSQKIYNMYHAKNKENIDRQKRGY